MLDFTDLEVWKKARAFRNDAYSICKSFGKDEKFRLVDQLLRSSRSVTANIAEGHGRFHFQENIQFCRIARGSLTESKDHLITALDIKLIEQSKFDLIIKNYDETLRLLNGYISYLQKRKKES